MILTFVPCRLKSTRLPNKSLLLINGISAIERCLINVSAIVKSNKTVLITSTESEDDAILNHNLNGKVKVFRGPVDDVLQRLIPAIDEFEPDHVIRVTGDCPLVSFEMAEQLIESHLATGADATFPKGKVALGTACEIYRTSAIRKLRQLFPVTNYSEYLIYYFSNNPAIFTINEVDVDLKFRESWRLTLDEANDLQLLNMIYKDVNNDNKPVSFNRIQDFFRRNPTAIDINLNNEVKYRDNKNLIELLKKATTYQ